MFPFALEVALPGALETIEPGAAWRGEMARLPCEGAGRRVVVVASGGALIVWMTEDDLTVVVSVEIDVAVTVVGEPDSLVVIICDCGRPLGEVGTIVARVEVTVSVVDIVTTTVMG